MFSLKASASFYLLVIFFPINSLCEISVDRQEKFELTNQNPFDDGRLVHMNCTKITSIQTKCRIVQAYNFVNNSVRSEVRSCNFDTIDRADTSNLKIGVGLTGLVSIGKDKAVLCSGDEYNSSPRIHLGIVDFRSCVLSQVTIKDAKALVAELKNNVVAYDDASFDFFFNDLNYSKRSDYLNKIHITKDGSVESEPTASKIVNGQIQNIMSIASRSSSKGFAYLNKNDAGFTLLLAKNNGPGKQVAKYEHLPIYTASNDFISACVKPDTNSDVTCAQYDENGNMKFSAIITGVDKNAQPKTVYNMARGGMLVMIAEYKECDSKLDCVHNTRYRVVKITADGKISGAIRTKELDDAVSRFKKTNIYKNDDSKYCATLFVQNSKDDEQRPKNYGFVVSCFAETDFSV